MKLRVKCDDILFSLSSKGWKDIRWSSKFSLYCRGQPASISTKFTETLKNSFIYSQVCVSVYYTLDMVLSYGNKE